MDMKARRTTIVKNLKCLIILKGAKLCGSIYVSMFPESPSISTSYAMKLITKLKAIVIDYWKVDSLAEDMFMELFIDPFYGRFTSKT